jgi:hypothetical protein
MKRSAAAPSNDTTQPKQKRARLIRPIVAPVTPIQSAETNYDIDVLGDEFDVFPRRSVAEAGAPTPLAPAPSFDFDEVSASGIFTTRTDILLDEDGLPTIGTQEVVPVLPNVVADDDDFHEPEEPSISEDEPKSIYVEINGQKIDLLKEIGVHYTQQDIEKIEEDMLAIEEIMTLNNDDMMTHFFSRQMVDTIFMQKVAAVTNVVFLFFTEQSSPEDVINLKNKLKELVEATKVEQRHVLFYIIAISANVAFPTGINLDINPQLLDIRNPNFIYFAFITSIPIKNFIYTMIANAFLERINLNEESKIAVSIEDIQRVSNFSFPLRYIDDFTKWFQTYLNIFHPGKKIDILYTAAAAPGNFFILFLLNKLTKKNQTAIKQGIGKPYQRHNFNSNSFSTT